MDKPDWIEGLSVVEIKPGDTLILKAKRSPNSFEYERLYKQLQEWLGSRGLQDVNVIVLDNGLDIEVRKEEMEIENKDE